MKSGIKSEQLGMEYSYASVKLLRQVTFKLVQELGKDVCFRCGLKIESIEQFSLDHIEPWLHVSPELFWDLNNISFSHRKCNCGARRSRKSKYGSADDVRKRNRDAFRAWYAIPANREAWNAKKRKKYQELKMASSSSLA